MISLFKVITVKTKNKSYETNSSLIIYAYNWIRYPNDFYDFVTQEYEVINTLQDMYHANTLNAQLI